MHYKCLSIAGFDGSGGAGIQADLKCFSALGCYGMNVLTSLPAQNTQRVISCYSIPLACISDQLDAIFEDITPDAIKIGMLDSSSVIELITDYIERQLKPSFKFIPIVLDPVMVSKGGSLLLQNDAIDILKHLLIPKVSLFTPNLFEAQKLLGFSKSSNMPNKEELAIALSTLGAPVLLKGGHDIEFSDNNDFSSHRDAYSNDVLCDGKKIDWFYGKRIHTQNTHGTGCTLSAAITVYLAKGYTLVKACQLAKTYLSGAILAAASQSVGKGNGPVHHFYQYPNWDASV